MYLKTPKRYTTRGSRRRLINLRWLWLYLLTPIVVVIGAGVWQNQAMLRKPIEDWLSAQAQAAADRVATMQAPTPTPTDSPANYLVVANAAYQRGAVDTAIANYSLAADGLPNDVALYYRLAHLMITNGQAQRGLEIAERAINADPYDPRGWAIKGMALDWLGESELAIAFIIEAIKLDPENAEAYSFLAEAYADNGNGEAAVEAAERALSIDPANFNVQRNYAYVLALRGDRDGAIQAYERALELEPSQAYIAFNLANLYFAEGDVDTGLALLRGVIDRNPENASAYALLSDALLIHAGEVGQAREAVERCTAIAPDNVSCLSTLGALQRAAGEFNLCARTLDRAIENGSTSALDYFYGGSCYIVIGDCNKAREILLAGMGLASTLETQTDIRDALAQCQIIVTLVPSPTPLSYATGNDSLFTPTPEADAAVTGGEAVEGG